MFFTLLLAVGACGDDDSSNNQNGNNNNNNNTGTCGDGEVLAASEQCDGSDLDGQTCADRGFFGGGTLACTSTCQFDDAGCLSVCGNQEVEPDEACDDGDTTAGDGCDASCIVEPGFTCTGSPSQCALTRCGDGIQAVSSDASVPSEGCDDGNATSGDGCDASCTLEPGWTCTGTAPTTCTSICGDGLRVGTEVCDGADLGSLTCATQSFDGGRLFCNASCDQALTPGCFTCGDDLCSPGEPGHCAADCPVAKTRGGEDLYCALKADGTVWCWGINDELQLGTEPERVSRYLPSPVSGITNAIDLGVGEEHACAVLADHTVWCWGENYPSKLGTGPGFFESLPVQVTGITTAVAISAGSEHTCAVLANGTVTCWGSNDYGMLGDGTQQPRDLPVPVLGLSNVRSVAGGDHHTCAQRSDGSLWCWGQNGDGELGDGTTTNRHIPVEVLPVTF